MKRMLVRVLAAGFGLATFSSLAHAGPNANALIQIHLQLPTTKNACGIRGQPGCNAIVTNGALYPNLYYAYLIVTQGNATAGVAGLQCGIHYNGASHAGVDVFAWNLCATLQFITPTAPVWPADGGGSAITWDSINACQRFEPNGPGTGVVANAGYFYMAAYSPDQLLVIPRPVDNQAAVAACNSEIDVIGGTGYSGPPSHLGTANFTAAGIAPGYNPCGGDPVEPATWSGIKGSYQH